MFFAIHSLEHVFRHLFLEKEARVLFSTSNKPLLPLRTRKVFQLKVQLISRLLHHYSNLQQKSLEHNQVKLFPRLLPQIMEWAVQNVTLPRFAFLAKNILLLVFVNILLLRVSLSLRHHPNLQELSNHGSPLFLKTK